MTEAEREELIEKMAREIGRYSNDPPWTVFAPEARAALAVAEPVIREQADNALREETARLREEIAAYRARKPVVYSPDAQAMSDRVKAAEAERDALREENARLLGENWELVMRAHALLSLLPPETTCGQVQEARAKLAAIREGGKGE